MTDGLKIEKLDALMKMLKVKMPQARIGILGQGGTRPGGLTNAQVGAFHEFGTSTLPVRSFLRTPISDLLGKRIKDAGGFTKADLAQTLEARSLVPFVSRMAIIAEGIVAEAFDTGGFGKWKPSNMRYKANAQTLVETQQLRNSITSEVKET